jgi:hypothetical protein
MRAPTLVAFPQTATRGTGPPALSFCPLPLLVYNPPGALREVLRVP